MVFTCLSSILNPYYYFVVLVNIHSVCVCLSVSGAQLQSSVERPCPGETVTFTCTIESSAHLWVIPSLDIYRSLLAGDQGQVLSDPPFQFTVTKVMAGSITSTTIVNATTNLNATLVVCRDGTRIFADQNTTINIIGEHAGI